MENRINLKKIVFFSTLVQNFFVSSIQIILLTKTDDGYVFILNEILIPEVLTTCHWY